MILRYSVPSEMIAGSLVNIETVCIGNRETVIKRTAIKTRAVRIATEATLFIGSVLPAPQYCDAIITIPSPIPIRMF